MSIASTTVSCAAEHIRVASFNIAEFGEGSHPDTRDLDAIAEMLVDANLDLVAIQEVAIQEVGVNEGGADQVAALRDELNERRAPGTPAFFSSVTPQSGDERCAVIYRSPVIMGDDIYWLDDDKNPGVPRDGGNVFYRIPVAIPFQADDFDFVLVICHLAWGDLTRRTNEVKAIEKFLRDDSDPEKDWIVLGDFNRYGKYSASSANKAFNELLYTDWRTVYRFPLLEAITEPDDMKVFRASRDEDSTTIAQSKNLYDQIIITAGTFNEFETEDPVLGQDVGILAFDMQEPYASNSDHNSVKYTVSDHRPIWIRLRIDSGDDD